MNCAFAFTHYLRDDAVYWAPPTIGAYGTRTFATGVSRESKWFDRADVFRKPTGEEATSSAVVLLAEDVVVGGYLWRGSILSLSEEQRTTPLSIDGARRIEAFEKTEVLSGGRIVRRVWL